MNSTMQARVGGDLRYTSEQEATIAPDAIVWGRSRARRPRWIAAAARSGCVSEPNDHVVMKLRIVCIAMGGTADALSERHSGD